MQANVAGIRRNIKNIAHNYTDAQKKVREATSNDQWGPSATLMAEIADLTYNTVAMAEIMKMIWKRLNDHGKNWRHVYKALIVLEYLIRTGSERVAEQCKQNIFAIQTLNEFQYLEEGKDQGVNVREKAKLLVTLLRDDERLKNERAKALKARERFAQHPSGFGSDGSVEGPTQHMYGASGSGGGFGVGGGSGAEGGSDRRVPPPTEIEFMRPLTVGEEELQLQLAMAMSKEEAAQEDAKRRSDDVRLQLALSQSEQDFKDDDSPVTPPHQQQQQQHQQQSHLLDLLDINLGGMSVSGPPQGAIGGASSADPWNIPTAANTDPWGRTSSPPVDPWAGRGGAAAATAVDPWLGGASATTNGGGGAPGAGAAFNNHHLQAGNSSRSNGGSDPWLGNNGANGVEATNGSLLNQLNNNNNNNNNNYNNGMGGADPWSTSAHSNNNNGVLGGGASASDPWGPMGVAQMGARPSPVGAITSPSSELDDFDIITNRTKTPANTIDNLLDDMDPLKTPTTNYNGGSSGAQPKAPARTPHSFLGENSALVNLDNLIKPMSSANTTSAAPTGGLGTVNPFSDRPNFFAPQPVPSINQLKQQTAFPVVLNQDPWAPNSSAAAASATSSATTNQNMNINWQNNNMEPARPAATFAPSNPFLS